MNISDVMIIVPIVMICYLAGIGFKILKHVSDEAIPFLLGVIGGVLGVIGMYTMPDFPANDILSAIAVGVMSGLASTGTHQIYKQINKFFKGE